MPSIDSGSFGDLGSKSENLFLMLFPSAVLKILIKVKRSISLPEIPTNRYSAMDQVADAELIALDAATGKVNWEGQLFKLVPVR